MLYQFCFISTHSHGLVKKFSPSLEIFSITILKVIQKENLIPLKLKRIENKAMF